MEQRQSIVDYLHGLLSAFGQIFFQRSALCGLYVIAGIAFNSLTLLAGALLGAAIAQFVAGYLVVDHVTRREGVFGFNGALLGLACSYFYPVGVMTCGLIAVASLAATLLQYYWLQRLAIACYTAPFVGLTWLLLVVFDPATGGADSATATVNATTNAADPSAYPRWQSAAADLLSTIFNSVGQVCFQHNPISGLLFWVGISLGSLRAGVWVLVAAVLAALFGWLSGLDAAAINSGIYGFNPVMFTLGCLQWPRLRRGRLLILVVMLLTPLSILLTWAFEAIGVSGLTAPFVMLLWLVSGCAYWSRCQVGDLVRV